MVRFRTKLIHSSGGNVVVLEFGSFLRVFRTHWRLTQFEMAELLCTSQASYSRMEAGTRPISMRDLQRIADQAGVSVHALIMAHFLLDENLAQMSSDNADAVQLTLLELADRCKTRAPRGMKDAAALGLLFDPRSESAAEEPT